MDKRSVINRTTSFFIRQPAQGGHKQYMIDEAKGYLAERKGKQAITGSDPTLVVDVAISPALGKEPADKEYDYDLFYILESGNWSHAVRADYGYFCSKHPENGCNCGFQGAEV